MDIQQYEEIIRNLKKWDDIPKEIAQIKNALAHLEGVIANVFITTEAQKQNQMPEFLSPAEVCRILRITNATFINKRRQGLIRAKKVANRVYVEKSEILRYLSQVKGEFQN